MTFRRVQTDRWLGGLAVLGAALLVAVGGYGFVASVGGSVVVVLAAPVAAAALLVAAVVWTGSASSDRRRTPYW